MELLKVSEIAQALPQLRRLVLLTGDGDIGTGKRKSSNFSCQQFYIKKAQQGFKQKKLQRAVRANKDMSFKEKQKLSCRRFQFTNSRMEDFYDKLQFRDHLTD